MELGIVTKNENGYYHVQNEKGKSFLCRVRGRLKQNRYSLLIGDKVSFVSISDHEGTIEHIAPRHNSLVRPSVANIDQVVLVVAAREPDINEILLNKLIIMIEHSAIPLVLVINKWDLHDERSQSLKAIYNNLGYPLLTTSILTKEGLEELRSHLKGKITAFAGPSGVGKSSLLNAIEPTFSFQTGAVSDKIKRGRHTTRHASLYSLDQDSFIMDTPGFSALDFTHLQATELSDLFVEFQPYQITCRFTSCSHTHEPDCAVKKAVEEGVISQGRYEAYKLILKEIQEKR